jgi:hypothetical protein
MKAALGAAFFLPALSGLFHGGPNRLKYQFCFFPTGVHVDDPSSILKLLAEAVRLAVEVLILVELLKNPRKRK